MIAYPEATFLGKLPNYFCLFNSDRQLFHPAIQNVKGYRFLACPKK
jgi:hypothetical protein